MTFTGKTGKIKLLRTNDIGHVWGPANDALHTEVTVVLDSAPDMGFGFTLRAGDDNLPSRLAMLSMLRDAFTQNLTIGIAYEIADGKKNGHLRRIEFHR
jgi:hypothetical protein